MTVATAEVPRGAAGNGTAESTGEATGEATTELRLLRGVPARIVENMTESISVPTATSVHPVPARLLEV